MYTIEHEGTHVQLGVEMATKHGEHPFVVNCIAAHHDDVARKPYCVVFTKLDLLGVDYVPEIRTDAFAICEPADAAVAKGTRDDRRPPHL